MEKNQKSLMAFEAQSLLNQDMVAIKGGNALDCKQSCSQSCSPGCSPGGVSGSMTSDPE